MWIARDPVSSPKALGSAAPSKFLGSEIHVAACMTWIKTLSVCSPAQGSQCGGGGGASCGDWNPGNSFSFPLILDRGQEFVYSSGVPDHHAQHASRRPLDPIKQVKFDWYRKPAPTITIALSITLNPEGDVSFFGSCISEWLFFVLLLLQTATINRRSGM